LFFEERVAATEKKPVKAEKAGKTTKAEEVRKRKTTKAGLSKRALQGQAPAKNRV